jgi:type I restriction enzyme M protein
MNNNNTSSTSSIVSKIWAFCNTLRDDGVGYGDYLEQLTYLLFLKMADEYSKPPYKRQMPIPKAYSWETLLDKSGGELELHYNTLLRELGKEKGILGQIFTKSQNKIQDPAKLYKLIVLINAEQWVMMGVKDKGDIYEGLLEKNAEDTKSGAGQYFTPRALIKAMVECIRPEPMKSIADPACGTGGFFLAAYDWMTEHLELDKEQKEFLKYHTFAGNEIVASTRRLALMNLFLHNIGDIDSETLISPNDSLIAASETRYDYVLANPPFGKKSSMTFTNEAGEQEKEDLTYNRQDFWVTTSNKQLNFVQHIKSMLKTSGKAAVVVPDNVLFEGGAGETVRKKLLETTDLHTILRLPTGIFYANGVKANVLFWDAKPSSKDPWTKEVWVYDYRTNVHHTLKKNPLKLEDLKEFIECYNPTNRHKRKETFDASPSTGSGSEGRWRKFTYDEIIARDKTSLDITWLKDQSLADLDNLPDPDELALEIVENLEAGLESFRAVIEGLKK